MPFAPLAARHHRHGSTGAGVAAGLIGGTILGTAISRSSSDRGARREAREAKRDIEDLRREQQQKEIATVQKMIEREQLKQHSQGTVNILLIAIAILFLAVIGLGIAILKKK